MDLEDELPFCFQTLQVRSYQYTSSITSLAKSTWVNHIQDCCTNVSMSQLHRPILYQWGCKDRSGRNGCNAPLPLKKYSLITVKIHRHLPPDMWALEPEMPFPLIYENVHHYKCSRRILKHTSLKCHTWTLHFYLSNAINLGYLNVTLSFTTF